MDLVLGVDAGGTASRAALFTLAGTRVGYGVAGGANAVALGFPTACANLATAVRRALTSADGVLTSGGALVRAVVVGMAGNAAMRQAVVERVLGGPAGNGVQGPAIHLPVDMIRTLGDVVTAFAAGTASPSGTVLISGTGAIAAKITDHVQVAAADGYGWQLGDEGSAFWLGRAAARATIRALNASARNPPITTLPPTPPTLDPTDAVHTLSPATHASEGAAPSPSPTDAAQVRDAQSPPTTGHVPHAHSPTTAGHVQPRRGRLTELVICQLLSDGPFDDPVGRLAAVVQGQAPLALAELAPLVSEAAAGGDPVALEIVNEAAIRLVRTVMEVHVPGLPIVLAGSVLTAEGPVRQAVLALLREETVSFAGDGAGAAAWLAARSYLSPQEAEQRHPLFVSRDILS
ncbi:BadF/BadG/BcrA/BcrD ATPase family protein [Nonomuraea sp. NPDC049141]|uniref:N-acetylglucosamine kinase n=1 Tax=Nonomuraea sp. NPDC049141 TaxID=3155500 RepID=UPI0033FC6AD6